MMRDRVNTSDVWYHFSVGLQSFCPRFSPESLCCFLSSEKIKHSSVEFIPRMTCKHQFRHMTEGQRSRPHQVANIATAEPKRSQNELTD